MVQMTLKSFIEKLIFISFLLTNCYAQSMDSVEVILASSSGQSAILSVGRLHGVKEGMHAIFMVNSGDLDYPKLEKVAEGELIRSLDNHSYWFFKTLVNPARIKSKQKLIYKTKHDSLLGVRPFKTLSRKRIFTDTTKNEDIDFENEVGVPPSLIVEGDEYVKSKELLGTNMTHGHDIEIQEFDLWAKRNGMTKIDDFMRSFESQYIDENFKEKSLHKDEVGKIKSNIYRAQIDGFISKVNKLKYGLKGFYRDQKKDNDNSFLKDRNDILNVYEQSREEIKRKRILGLESSNKVRRDGDLWSADFDDEALRNYMLKSGIEEEEIRQYKTLTEKTGNEITFRISSSVNNHSTDEDDNHRNNGYSVAVGYEYHLMRTSPTLLKYAIEVYAQRSIENIDLGGINGRFSMGSFGGQFLYYFYNNPAILNQWAWSVGIGARRGNADVTSIELSDSYEFQVVGLPTWSIGTKYRFKTGDSFDDDIPVGAGFNLRLSGERMSLSSVSTNVDDINTTILLNDIKLTVGLSVYF
ncbi:hypothetical protein [Halobacteriovorax sp.]|uniref:hypothetical protein n=1 Tax=Halobacteriovorax sp. TaxID=2020862 RepID=UPI003569BABF